MTLLPGGWSGHVRERLRITGVDPRRNPRLAEATLPFPREEIIMAFRGWPVEAIEFYEGLEADNSKPFWQSNKHVYDEQIRAPMEALLAELEPEFGEGRIFRPYRDVRFSADKSPYKTHIGATIGSGYVQLGPDGLAGGCGMWEMSSDQLDRYRRAVDDPGAGEDLEAIVAAVRREGHDVMSREQLKSAPRGYPKDHPRIENLRRKGIATWHSWGAGAWLGTKRAKTRIEGFFRDSRPLVEWLDEHVGPPEVLDRR
jgi:uncharacterized protein (TIGR02453 family)